MAFEDEIRDAIPRGHGQSKTDVLRSQFDNLEDARRRGVSIETLVSILRNQGLEISERVYEVLTSRIRAERRLKQGQGLAGAKETRIPIRIRAPPEAYKEKDPNQPLTQARIRQIRDEANDLEYYE